MSMDPVKAKREAEIRDKLPDDVTAMVDAVRAGDTIAAFDDGVLARMRDLYLADFQAWSWVREALVESRVQPIGEWDRRVKPAGGEGDGKQGREMEWPDPDPCPDPVDGAPMLSDIAAFIRRHVWIDEPEADALALWAVMTWIHDRLEISTFANLTSATKRCGKSLLLELLAELVYRPQPLSGQVTGAVLFRMVEVHAPTLMLDEADTYIRDDEAVRGIVNGSQRRALAYIPRCVEPDYQPRLFGTWCPKLIAGIGGIPDTIRDRSLVVRLERKPASERVSPWRERDREAVNAMRGQIARWTGDNAGRIVAARSAVAFPDVLHDRARDAWESLLAIANAAGGEWAGRDGRAWRACEHFAAAGEGDEGGAREMLLADLCAIFDADGWPEAIASATIVERLRDMEGRPWSEWKRGKPITVRQLASLLRPFDVHPRNHRAPGGQSKAYFLAALRPVFDAYLPNRGEFDPSRRPNALKQGVSVNSHPSRPETAGRFGNHENPYRNRGWDGGTDRNPGSPGNGAEPAPELPKQPPDSATLGDAYRLRRDGE